jgi:hypothetical protein
MNEFSVRKYWLSANAPMCLFILLVTILGSSGTGFAAAADVRARDYTRNLADQLEGVVPGDPLIHKIRSAADSLDALIKATPSSDPAGAFRAKVEQALRDAGTMSGLVANRLEELLGTRRGIPPNVPDNPWFRQTFSNVHGSRGDQK